MSTRIFLATLGLALAGFTPTAASANDKAIIVLDASGSMWGQIDGKTKIEIARQTLTEVLGGIPDTLDLGLIAYGHREKGSCSDIEEIVRPEPGTRDAISAAVRKLNPKGKTPIADAVEQAAISLAYTEDKATVIVITDGIETCNADPCALASELEAAGIDFTAHVIGFGLTAEEGRKVACLAENTGGRYLQASNAAELAGALTETVAAQPAPAPEPAPKPQPEMLEKNILFTASLTAESSDNDPEGTWEAFLMNGDTPGKDNVLYSYAMPLSEHLDPGRYLVRFSKDLVKVEQVVETSATELLTRNFVLDAGIIRVSVAADEAAEVDDSARFDIKVAGGETGGYGQGTFVVPAGDVQLTASLGEASTEESLVLKAGEVVDRKLVAAAGVLAADVTYSDGGPLVEDGSLRVDVLSAKMSIDGKRKDITGGYGPGNRFKLAPGDYLLRAELGAASVEEPVTVKKGEMTPVSVNLNAGVLNVRAPGAYRIDILPAKADLQGRREPIGGSYGEEFQITAPPGDYKAVATMSGDGQAPDKELPVSVSAAERTEVTIE
ncbi:Ca-activated chloride channel family protein [Hoeflea marina]|uniref:Ca-activated chloride channel family protein n=1 Tax=Hoeflea marina TaxID=274592 RepID=A0A317PTJ2_9HYPH|nr:VWA domain-containing protein [Hoeflea marina]PWW04257.1 Ca-activated chloride channel family protein [Hoeflea marina]